MSLFLVDLADLYFLSLLNDTEVTATIVFLASGRTKELVVFFCTWIALSWAFAGAQFVSNAACNNLGKATHSTWFNWAKATLGTIPFAIVGGQYWTRRHHGGHSDWFCDFWHCIGVVGV